MCFALHNGVHFLDISTSKSGPRRSVFNNFDLPMCFAPQPCPLFRHLNFRTWGVFNILASKCVLGHSDVHFLMSHTTRWLRTRRFSEPTFGLSWAPLRFLLPRLSEVYGSLSSKLPSFGYLMLYIPGYTWIFIGCKSLFRADVVLISVIFLDL
jgi:hypothetical protein